MFSSVVLMFALMVLVFSSVVCMFGLMVLVFSSEVFMFVCLDGLSVFTCSFNV